MNTETNETQMALRIPEVARRLDVHPRTIYRLIEGGNLHAVKVGRAWRVPPEALQEFLDRRTTQRVVSSQLMRRVQRMEGAWETFKEFRRRGIELVLDDGQLTYRQTRTSETVPEELLRAADRYRAELSQLLDVE